MSAMESFALGYLIVGLLGAWFVWGVSSGLIELKRRDCTHDAGYNEALDTIEQIREESRVTVGRRLTLGGIVIFLCVLVTAAWPFIIGYAAVMSVQSRKG